MKKKTAFFFHFNLLECVYNIVKSLLAFKTDKMSRGLSQLEVYGRESGDFTDHIDTDEEKLNFSPSTRIANNNHGSDEFGFL